MLVAERSEARSFVQLWTPEPNPKCFLWDISSPLLLPYGLPLFVKLPKGPGSQLLSLGGEPIRRTRFMEDLVPCILLFHYFPSHSVTCCFRPHFPFIQVRVGSPPSHPTASAINGNMAYCSNQKLQWLFVVSSFSQLCLSHLPNGALFPKTTGMKTALRKFLNITSV